MKSGIPDTSHAVPVDSYYRRIIDFVLRTGGLVQKFGRILGNPSDSSRGQRWVAYPVLTNENKEKTLLVLQDEVGNFHRLLVTDDMEF